MQTQKIEHHHQNEIFVSYLAKPNQTQKPSPAVLIFPDWSGVNEFACERADALSELGYTAFAVDLYGEGRIGKNNDEKSALMHPLISNRSLLKERLLSAMETLKKIHPVDAKQIAAIGFCFGGLCALDLARSGTDIAGAVSFHGLLSAPENYEQKKIHAKILALHGNDDPMVPIEQVLKFQKEMTDAKADWQIHIYGGAMHAFANPLANDPDFGTVYNALAAKRSWQAMQDFFAELFF